MRLLRGKVWLGCLLLCAVGPAQAQAKSDWSALGRLKSGKHPSTILVQRVHPPEPPDAGVPCQFVSMTPDSLTCVAEYGTGQQLVFARTAVGAVYRVKTVSGIHVPRVILGAAAGWLVGGIITDGGWDYPLAALGALVGAGLGVASSHPHRHQEFSPVYCRLTGLSSSCP